MNAVLAQLGVTFLKRTVVVLAVKALEKVICQSKDPIAVQKEICEALSAIDATLNSKS